MNKNPQSDKIIAVKEVKASSLWNHSLFGFRSKHGGSKIEIFVDEKMK